MSLVNGSPRNDSWVGRRESGRGFVLGLDLGVSSIGWAIVREREDGGASVRCGAHLFEPGTDGSDADRLRGAEVPANQARRLFRQSRRQTWRRWRRKRSVLRALIDAGLLPPAESPLRTGEMVDEYVKAIDAELRPRWTTDHGSQQTWLYGMRREAVLRPLDAVEVGRALYHLAQRRGFQSNRRTDAKDTSEDRSKAKAAIASLADQVAANDPPTLGAYLASLDTAEERLRGRWTSRAMYEDEFARIWDIQAGGLGLTDDQRHTVERAMFRQRPLRPQSDLVGRCSLVPDQRRAPIAIRSFQRFRVLQAVNNLQVSVDGASPRALTAEERDRLLDALMTMGDRTVTQAKKPAGLKRTARFNIEDDDQKKIIGHRTDAKLRAVFGARFDAFSESERDELVVDLRSIRKSETLAKRGRERWGLDADAAAALADTHLEEGHASLSLAAIEALLPDLEAGVAYATARRSRFPESFRASEVHDALPPVIDAVAELRNPGVLRAMTELRKLINRVITEYGKPDVIRVEMARDLKHGPARREAMHRTNRKREREREIVASKIVEQTSILTPSRDDVLRWMLADECGWICPYTGRAFGWEDLLGPNPQIDVEHIWPRARSLDDGYLNKTLCFHDENRSRKRGYTPFEAYSEDRDRWHQILHRVASFSGDQRTTRAKMDRFLAEEIPEGFSNRHLSDTRYISRVAADYLGLLYGGRVDPEATQRVQTRTGGVTAWLRTGWGLSRVLSADGAKNRDDHRHHAVDAIVVALTDQAAVQSLARAAQSADVHWKHRAFERIDEPWESFREDAKAAIGSVIVSHRTSRRVSGPLHEATIYSKPVRGAHRVRKELFKLSRSDIAKGRIVDKRAHRAIVDKLSELGYTSPTDQQIARVFADPANAPLVKGADGAMVRLRRVRVEVDARPAEIDQGKNARFVKLGNNHHTVIWVTRDAKGRERWEHQPVTMFEAYRRRANGEPIISRDGGPDRTFLFSLSKGEHVEMDDPDNPGTRAIFRVLAFSEGEIKVIRTHDARQSAISGKDRIRPNAEKLRRLNARKVLITYLGEVRRASD